MNETFIKFFEIAFNLSYLIIIWYLVIKMYKNYTSTTGNIFRLAFLFLAFGDTFHVGFRVIAHLLGDINYTTTIFGQTIKLIGSGAFMTAVTVSITYLLFSRAYTEKTGKTTIHKSILILTIIRLILLVFPQNNWQSVVSYEWGLLRNLPLTLIGVIMAYEFIKNGGDTYFRKLGYWIVISYLFYLPVILFVQKIPMLGMLMIPKTVAYLFMVLLIYKKEFKAT